MIPVKKLAYYAKCHGLDDVFDVELSEEDCVRICGKVGVRHYTAAECHGSIYDLVNMVFEDPDFVNCHHTGTDLNEIRMIDYAANEIVKAYLKQ